jgi:hypothetical protein
MKQLVYIKTTEKSIKLLRHSGLPEKLINDLLNSIVEVDENYNYSDPQNAIWSLPPESCFVWEDSF